MFLEAEALLGGDNVRKPRVIDRQTMRANPDVPAPDHPDAMDYFRISSFYTYSDTVIVN